MDVGDVSDAVVLVVLPQNDSRGAATLAELDGSLVEQAPPLPHPHILSAFPLLDEGY